MIINTKGIIAKHWNIYWFYDSWHNLELKLTKRLGYGWNIDFWILGYRIGICYCYKSKLSKAGAIDNARTRLLR